VREANYKIYNASAGSGKTYTLAKEYLKIVLAPTANKSYRHILAITFTNKAVNEMKGRILGSLFQFGQTFGPENAPPMFLSISQELGMSATELQKKSRHTLKSILHNYAFFDVSTIDKFTHRLLRTFARDLKLPQNFEVVLDTDLLLEEAVARLINRAGTEEGLTKVLLDFALEKANEDKSWDIGPDLFKIGKLIFQENNAVHLQQIGEKSMEDFLELKKTLSAKLQACKAKIKANALKIMDIIATNGLEFSDFRSSYFPNFISKIAQGDLEMDFKAAWKQNFGNEPLYTKTCKSATKATLDALQPQFTELFHSIQQQAHPLLFLQNAYRNIVPLTVLNAIGQELGKLQSERDQLPISSFNAIISKEIKNQPAPFIYERLGEKYSHYFIDEFQDTSEMQWNNLTPLIGNALESEDLLGQKGSLLLVGDAKQAIYRWRGGKAEQFLNLINLERNPFVVAPKTENLPANYRSCEEVIRFNNDFFTLTSPFLNKDIYQQLFVDGNQQEYNSKKGGLVRLDFIGDGDGTDEGLYCDRVLATIRDVLERNFQLRDICILTRNRKHGVLIANFLMEMGIPIISSETLLLRNSPKVRFLVDLLAHCSGAKNRETAYSLLYFLADKTELGAHHFIAAHLDHLDSFLKSSYGFDMAYLAQHSVYDGLEYAIKQFDLASGSEAYLTHLLDVVLELEIKGDSGPQAFLAHWEKKKDNLSLTATDNVNAVQIMTVHKSKGLEFPVVLFPFANDNIYKEIDAKLWLPVDEDDFNGFSEVLVSKKQEVRQYGEQAAALYDGEQHKLELDAFNVLYVALTRAVQALYIVTKKDVLANGQHKTDLYSGLFIHYLMEKGLWDPQRASYTFGELGSAPEGLPLSTAQDPIPFLYTSKDRSGFKILTKSGSLWECGADKALERGNIVHQLLGYMDTADHMEGALAIMLRNGDIGLEETRTLKAIALQVVHHPELKDYYRAGNIIRNEREIITESGLILRPDRLVIQGKRVTIIDYKTGKPNPVYHQQLTVYARAVEAMGLVVHQKIIVYINETITPEFI
jgi:ATP-dependent exoDNAse (exonuclease V) beta subunit